MRLLLHACCGPCLIEPLDALRPEHDVTVAYANPNIHPLEEYRRRRDSLLAYAAVQDVEVVEVDYDPASWIRDAGRFADDPARRCVECYRLRLGATAQTAAERGLDAIATTLTVSPYQDPEAIAQAGAEAAAAVGIVYLHEDYRGRYPQSVARSKALEMYRQRYCGCLISELEAERSRSAKGDASP